MWDLIVDVSPLASFWRIGCPNFFCSQTLPHREWDQPPFTPISFYAGFISSWRTSWSRMMDHLCTWLTLLQIHCFIHFTSENNISRSIKQKLMRCANSYGILISQYEACESKALVQCSEPPVPITSSPSFFQKNTHVNSAWFIVKSAGHGKACAFCFFDYSRLWIFFSHADPSNTNKVQESRDSHTFTQSFPWEMGRNETQTSRKSFF